MAINNHNILSLFIFVGEPHRSFNHRSRFENSNRF